MLLFINVCEYSKNFMNVLHRDSDAMGARKLDYSNNVNHMTYLFF